MNISNEQNEELLKILRTRFHQHSNRHPDIEWDQVKKRLAAERNQTKLGSLYEMEQTGGEPDVVHVNDKTGELLFFDCSPESPAGRRSTCYDQEALKSRKKYPPKNNAADMAARMGIEILNEENYRRLQELGNFDTKTSSWLKTPESVRDLGGAIFGDYRYGRVFIYHNGAESYYAARGFRSSLNV